jgi:hypothetical protein
MRLARLVLLTLAVFLFIAVAFCCSAYAVTSDEAQVKIAEADGSIRQAFLVVSDAAGAGANVSSLTFRLNAAGGLLAQATIAYRTGDYGNAAVFADQSISSLDGIVQDAGDLRAVAESDRLSQLGWTASFSSVGLSLLFVVGLFGWRFVRNRYFGSVLELKPEEAGGS